MEQKPGQQQKIEDREIQAMEITVLKETVNKTKKNRKRNANVRLELGVYEIKHDIKNIILWLFGHRMRVIEERIPTKII